MAARTSGRKDDFFAAPATFEHRGRDMDRLMRVFESTWKGQSIEEGVNPIGPRSVYDEAKRYAEAITTAYRYSHGIDTRIARIFNTYGPRMLPNDGRVVSNFIVQALKGEPITLYGDGLQTRSFCYVDDLIEGLVRLMNAPDTSNQPVNLGNPRSGSIRELATLVLALTGSRSNIKHHAGVEDDPRDRCPEISRALDQLGWSLQVNYQLSRILVTEKSSPFQVSAIQDSPIHFSVRS